jgi:hypothetical protein
MRQEKERSKTYDAMIKLMQLTVGVLEVHQAAVKSSLEALDELTAEMESSTADPESRSG